MTLHEAIAYVIEQAGKPLSVLEITDRINSGKLYRRKKDDKPVEPKQIMLRLGNNLDKFDVVISNKN
ncbi:winged helix-turn-helix domain-containing protein [Alistipes sp. OttesenSCG-928-B03]|nr:winged helix-turn-helix domain-containing protein [Alistipes sp. OttesenSCG-928-B03]